MNKSRRRRFVIVGAGLAGAHAAETLRLEEGRVAAAMNADVGDTSEAIQALIRSRRPVVTDRLRDSQLRTDEVLAAA